MTGLFVSIIERVTLQIISLKGEVMLNEQLWSTSEIKLSTGNLRPGMYILLLNKEPAGIIIKR